MSTQPLSVDCRPTGDGWLCTVTVGGDPGRTVHEVQVGRSELSRLAPGHDQPDALVSAAFGFLLEREPRDSILPTFRLPVIERYFPEFPSVIGGLLSAEGGEA